MKYAFVIFVCLLSFSSISHAQKEAAMPVDAGDTLRKMNERLAEEATSKAANSSRSREDYRIGPEDLIDIAVFEVPELSRTVRVGAGGEISLPLLGSVQVATLSPLDLEARLTDLLRKSYVKDPQVTVFVREFHSDPVSVVGAVKMPGLYQIQTHKTLIEVLAMAQGFSEGPSHLPGRDIVVTRKLSSSGPASPSDSLQAVSAETSGGNQTAANQTIDVPIKELMESGDSKWNVPIFPGDVVKVVTAGTVYVAGEVVRPGGFALTNFENVSVIQALSIAGGTLRTAVRKNSVIIRRDAAGNRVEQKVDLGRVLKGQNPDIMLGANDILFVPGSAGKAAALRTLESTIQMATGMLIYNRPF